MLRANYLLLLPQRYNSFYLPAKFFLGFYNKITKLVKIPEAPYYVIIIFTGLLLLFRRKHSKHTASFHLWHRLQGTEFRHSFREFQQQ